MRHLDLKVIDQALEWARIGRPIWLCTVLSTYGSSPREPGAMLVATDNNEFVGSLSGGCVEEEFLQSLADGAFRQPVQRIRYGDSPEESRRLRLPCGGSLQVLVEHPISDERLVQHLQATRGSSGAGRVLRQHPSGTCFAHHSRRLFGGCRGLRRLCTDTRVRGDRL